MYFIAFRVCTSAKTRKNPGRNKDSENIHLGRNRTRRTEYTPLIFFKYPRDGSCQFLGQLDHFPENVQLLDVKNPPTKYFGFSEILQTLPHVSMHNF